MSTTSPIHPGAALQLFVAATTFVSLTRSLQLARPDDLSTEARVRVRNTSSECSDSDWTIGNTSQRLTSYLTGGKGMALGWRMLRGESGEVHAYLAAGNSPKPPTSTPVRSPSGSWFYCCNAVRATLYRSTRQVTNVEYTLARWFSDRPISCSSITPDHTCGVKGLRGHESAFGMWDTTNIPVWPKLGIVFKLPKAWTTPTPAFVSTTLDTMPACI